VRGVGPRLAPEVRVRIATVRRWLLIVWPLDRLEALHRSPGLDQGAVDAEVFGGQEPLDPGLPQDGVQEPTGDSAFQQAVPVLREGRMIPGRVVDPEPDEPAE